MNRSKWNRVWLVLFVASLLGTTFTNATAEHTANTLTLRRAPK